jgi:hypothetical protein
VCKPLIVRTTAAMDMIVTDFLHEPASEREGFLPWVQSESTTGHRRFDGHLDRRCRSCPCSVTGLEADDILAYLENRKAYKEVARGVTAEV